MEELDLLVADAVGLGAGGRFHEGEGQHLHDVVLDDVPQGTGRLVEPASMLDTEALGHGHLHLLDIPSVPDRLEDGIGKAKGQDVLNGLLAHVVVDPEDLALVEGGVHLLVQGDGAVEVAAVGLLHHHPDEGAAFTRMGAGMVGEGPGHQAEHARDGGQVVEPVAGGPVEAIRLVEMVLQTAEGVRVVVLASHVLEALGELLPLGATLGSGPGNVGAELLVGPRGAGHPDHGEAVVEDTAIGQPGQGGQDLAGGEVPGRTEDDHRRRWGLGKHRGE